MVLKYVIFDHAFVALTPKNGGVQHCELSIKDYKPTSAGFVTFNNGEVNVFGESTSLRLKPGKADAVIISRVVKGY